MITGTTFAEMRRMGRESPRQAAATIAVCSAIVGFVAGLGGAMPGSLLRGLVLGGVGLAGGTVLAVVFLKRVKQTDNDVVDAPDRPSGTHSDS